MIHKIADEEWQDEQDCSSQMVSALLAICYRLQQEGLTDCLEFDKAQVAIARYEELQKRSIARLKKKISELEDEP